MRLRLSLAAWNFLSAVLPAGAQTVSVVPVERVSAPVAPAGGMTRALVNAPSLSSTLSLSGPSLRLAPSAPKLKPAVRVSATQVSVISVENPVSRSVTVIGQAEEAPRVLTAAQETYTQSHESRRHAVVAATVELEVVQWGPPRRLETLPVAARAFSGPRPTLAPALEAPREETQSVPSTVPEISRAKPNAARAAFIAGAGLVAFSAAAFAFPALTPAALAAWKGPALWAGFSSLSLSRYWRTPGAGVESPRGPPEKAKGWFKSVKEVWLQARRGAEAQVPLESKVGGSSVKSVRNWFLGGLRAAAVWIPVTMATMLAGWGLAKPFAGLAKGADAVGAISFEEIQKLSLGGHMLGFVASSLSAEAATLAVFDGARALCERWGAGKAAPWIAGAAALAVSAGLIMLVTTTPMVVGTMLGIEAGLLWLRVRSKSWLAPLVLRAFFSLLSLEAARFGVHLILAAPGVLKGLPEVWTGVAVAGLLAAGLLVKARSKLSGLWPALKAQVRRVGDFGAAWRSARGDGAPQSPWPLLKLASLWALVLYAAGDMVFWATHALFGGAEPAPAILAKMLTSPVDLVLYNFLLVGFLEEYVFRRGLFKPMWERLSKWGVTGRKAFWIAAVASGLIFSYAHYIDFGSMLAKFGLADAAATSGLGGTYALTAAGFITRAFLGVVLAWLYAASGTLLLPIFAHALADTFEGLGLRWGIGPFLAMTAAALLLQFIKKKPAIEPSSMK